MESDADLDAFTPTDHSVGSSIAEELLLFCTTFNYFGSVTNRVGNILNDSKEIANFGI